MAVECLKDRRSCSERNACKLVSISRNVSRYEFRIKPDEHELIELIQALSNKHKRYGYSRISKLVRRKGKIVNKKRIKRIWREQGLSLKQRKAKKRRYGSVDLKVTKAERKHHVWTYDFLEDRTEKGRKLRFLCVVDEYTGECLAIRVEAASIADIRKAVFNIPSDIFNILNSNELSFRILNKGNAQIQF